MDPLIAFLFGVGAALVLLHLILIVAAGGNLVRLNRAFACFFRLARDAALAAKVQALMAAPPEPDKPARPSGVPVRVLALLQREGRLLDFLLEEIQGYSDEQIGAAVRDIHRQCRTALQEHLVLEPILPQSEGESVQVPAGFDPSAIRLTGNVTGEPPFQGKLQHHGWRVKEVKLAPLPEGQDDLVIQPAEVELP